MGFLSAYEGTRRVTVGDPERGYWVDLVLHISQGAKEAAERAATRMRVSQAGAAVGEPDVAAYRQLMVLGHIQGWNLDDDNGRPWPVTLESVKRLPGDVFEELWVVVNELTAPRSREEQQRFPDAGDGGAALRRPRARKSSHVHDGAAVLDADRGEPQDSAGTPG